MKMYFLGIDIGGTLTKSALFDNEGNEIAVSSVNTPLSTPRRNFQERDMEELWKCTAQTIKGVITKSGINPEDIKGIGCTGHGKGLYLWGKDDKPAYPAIASTDHRAADIVERWKKDGTNDKAKEKTLQNIVDCQPVAILAWIRENEPEVYKNIKWIFEAKDYIRFRLTGEAFAEKTDYSGAALLDLKTADFDQDLMDVYGLGDLTQALPPVKNSYDICGYITEAVEEETGLKAGTAVCGGMFDIDACAIAMDVSTEEKFCVITGTWSINEYISKTPISPESTTMNSLFGIPGYYLIEESSATSAGNLEWVINTILGEEKKSSCEKGESVYKYVDEAVSKVDAGNNIFFLPYLYGTNTGCSSGAFLGLSNGTEKAELLRAVFEGVAFSHMLHIKRLLRYREKPKAIRIAGGVTKSEVWLQIFADVIGIPLEVVTTKELGAMGCAMAGAVAAGIYKDYSEAAKSMTKLGKVIIPDNDAHEIYKEKFAKFEQVTKALEII